MPLRRKPVTRSRRADAPQALEQLRISLLGKRGGQLSRVLGAMGSLPHAQRPLMGQRANVLKKELQELLNERLRQLEEEALTQRLAAEAVDVSAPGSLQAPGSRSSPAHHPGRDRHHLLWPGVSGGGRPGN